MPLVLFVYDDVHRPALHEDVQKTRAIGSVLKRLSVIESLRQRAGVICCITQHPECRVNRRNKEFRREWVVQLVFEVGWNKNAVKPAEAKRRNHSSSVTPQICVAH